MLNARLMRAFTAPPAANAASKPMSVLFGGRLSLVAGVAPLAHGEKAALVTETRCFDLSGNLWGALLPLLDGTLTANEIVRALRADFAVPEVLEALGTLANERLLATENAGTIEPQASGISLHVAGTGEEFLVAQLGQLGVTVEPDGDHAMLELVLVDDYLDLSDLAASRRERCWLPVKLAGEEAWFGPLFRPNDGPCWSCLEHRLKLTREAWHLTRDLRPASSTGVNAATAAYLCAVQVDRWLQDANAHPLHGMLATLSSGNLQLDLHPVTKRPQCSTCGTVQSAEAQPPDLVSVGDGARHDAGERSAEGLLETYAHHVDEITGLVGALETVAKDPVHVSRARFVRPRPGGNAATLLEGRRNVAAGKGTTGVAARAGALAESLERYSTTWDGSEALVEASLEELGDQAIHPNASMLFSESQLAEGSRGRNIKLHVPEPFDPSAKTQWQHAWSISRGEWRHVAAGWALMGYQGPGASQLLGDSNGNAAGSNLADAVLAGAGEVVERDAAALWWYNRVPRPGVCLDGIDPAYLQRLTSHYRAMGREFWVLDLTSDIAMPVFAAVSCRTGGVPVQPLVAFGAHLDPRTAVIRALTEMNQMLPHAQAEAPREDRPALGSQRADSMGLASIDGHAYLKPALDLPQTRLDSFATPATAAMSEQIDWLDARLQAAGLELLVIDQTRPDVGLPVVRVIVPGMRHFWRRLAPGRLYDVPVKLGWRDRPLSENEVNPLDLAI